MFKKMTAGLTALLLLASLFALTGCTKTNSGTEKKNYSVVCTIFPQYDWVRQILGNQANNIDLTLLLDNGVDLHSYQPTADDMIKISQCDLFIYVGGESDKWVVDALKEAVNKNMTVINMLDVLGNTVKEEEVVEGMQTETPEATDEAEEGPEYDEHVWLSLKNAKTLCGSVRDALIKMDPENKSTYTTNAETYINKLGELDGSYQTMVNNAVRKTVLFGDRFPFRYMMENYNLQYYAAFVGCSAETEASFETVAFLSKKVDAMGLPCVLVLEDSDQKIAKTIISNTTNKDQKIVIMDSMQNVTAEKVSKGYTYESAMESNLESLRQALN